MFSFVLDEEDIAHCKINLETSDEPEVYVRHVFERMKEQSQIQKMIREIDLDIAELYDIPVEEVCDFQRMICPLMEDVWFYYSYWRDAEYIRKERDRKFKAIIALKRFYDKIVVPKILGWYYHPDGPGGIKTIERLYKQAFDNTILSRRVL